MTDPNKKLAQEIKKLLEEKSEILIVLHPSPDEDSIGSSLALFLALEKMGKRPALIVGDGPLPQKIKYFPGSDKIINKKIQEIDLANFKILLLPDISSENQISKENLTLPTDLTTISFDHHVSNSGFANINILEKYSSASQVIFELLLEWGIDIDEKIAANLIAGIYFDTDGFKYDLSPNIFDAMSFLIKKSGNLAKDLILNLSNNYSLNSLKLRAYTTNNHQKLNNNAFRLISISQETLNELAISAEDIISSNLANFLLGIENTIAAASLIEKSPGKISVSLRSRDVNIFNALNIALALGGGGHEPAAGATIVGDVKQAEAALLNKMKELIPSFLD